MRFRSLLAPLLVAGAACASPAAAATPIATASADEQLDAQALGVLNAATKQVLRSNPKCRPQRVPRQRTVLTNDDPDPGIARLLGVMRRPPTPEELEAAEDLVRNDHWESGRIYRRYVRFVYVGDYRLRLSVRASMAGPNFDAATFNACEDKIRAQIPKAGADADAAVVTRARELQAEFRREELRKPRRSDPYARFEKLDWLTLDATRRDGFGSEGVGGTPFRPKYFSTHGLYTVTEGHRRSGRAFVLVPDGVASVEARFGRVNKAPYRSRKQVFNKRVIKTASVADNIATFAGPRRPDVYEPLRITWYDANGKTIRVITRTQPFF